MARAINVACDAIHSLRSTPWWGRGYSLAALRTPGEQRGESAAVARKECVVAPGADTGVLAHALGELDSVRPVAGVAGIAWVAGVAGVAPCGQLDELGDGLERVGEFVQVPRVVPQAGRCGWLRRRGLSGCAVRRGKPAVEAPGEGGSVRPPRLEARLLAGGQRLVWGQAELP